MEGQHNYGMCHVITKAGGPDHYSVAKTTLDYQAHECY